MIIKTKTSQTSPALLSPSSPGCRDSPVCVVETWWAMQTAAEMCRCWDELPKLEKSLTCSAVLSFCSARSSFLQVSEANSSSSSVGSPSLPLTRTVAAREGRLGAAESVISTSLFFFLPLLQAFRLSSSMASDSHGSGNKDENGEDNADLLILFTSTYVVCWGVTMCSENNAAYKHVGIRRRASLPPPSPPFSQPPTLPASCQPHTSLLKWVISH